MLTPWHKMLYTVNMVLAGAVGFCLIESIIFGMFWFLEHLLKIHFPSWVKTICSGTTFITAVVFVVHFFYEDLTAHGKRLTEEHRTLFKQVEAAQQSMIQAQASQQTSNSDSMPLTNHPRLPVASSDEQTNVQQIQTGNSEQLP